MPQRSFSRDQGYLVPPSLDEWIAPDHPVRFVAALVETLTAEEWEALGVTRRPERMGAPRYAPELLLSAWLAGFMLRIRTSRKLEYACRYDLTLRWLTAGQMPDHNTLWRFYRNHRSQMRVLLRKTVLIAVEADMVELAVQAVDGSKVLANVAKTRTLNAEELQDLLERIDAAIDELESQQGHDDDPPPPGLPQDLASQQALRQRVADALGTVTAAGGPRQINVTDPEARFMKTRQGPRMAYNAQAVVTPLNAAATGSGGRIILAAAVTTRADDHDQLAPMIAAADLSGCDPPITLADGGYHSASTVAACEHHGYPVVMPESQTARQRSHPYHKDQFTYDPDADTYTCPQGRVLTRRGQHQHRGQPQLIYRGNPSRCRTCSAWGVCTTNQRWGRSLAITVHDGALRRHRRWMATDEARTWSAKRKSLIELVFGVIKQQLGGDRFWLRGQANVEAEWTMLALGYNLKTLARVWGTTQTPTWTGDHHQHSPAPVAAA